MLLMYYSVKCTRRHAGGICSISVRMAALKPLGSEFFLPTNELQTGVEPRINASVVKKMAAEAFFIKGVIYCSNS